MNNPTAWTGWYRLPRGQWQPVVTAATKSEAWQRLGQHSARVGAPLSELVVLPEGQHPGGRRMSGHS